MSLTTLPLCSLVLSSLNVRRTERDADIEALAEDIAARGLKQNLVVIPAHFSTAETSDNYGDRFEVIAGGRRFQALQLLAGAGRIAHDLPIPVMVEAREDARETSLSENLHKVTMNPADEFAAFKQITDLRTSKHGDAEAAAIAYTAKRFGATVAHVEGRLRLATLAPEILDALRANLIGIEAAKAYATTADHDVQRKIFAQIEKDSWRTHDPKSIRAEVRGKTLPLDHALVNFVGLVTYQAEGGRIEAEMFMGTQGQQRVVDVPLLEKLAQKIGDAAVPAMAKADGYKQGLFYVTRAPKAPDGLERAWDYDRPVSKAGKKKSVAIYTVNDDGTGIEYEFRYAPPAKSEPVEPRDWEAERRASEREKRITAKAARMAAPSVKGTPLEGKAYWPTGPAFAWQRDEDAEFEYLIQWIKIPRADIEANLEEATRLVDEAIAAEATAKEAPSADADTDEDDGADELVTDEAEG